MNRRLAVLLGAAALALPGGALIGNAVAADGGGDSSSTEAPLTDPGFAPTQEQQPDDDQPRDRRDCPEDRQGGDDGGGSGSGSGSSSTTL